MRLAMGGKYSSYSEGCIYGADEGLEQFFHYRFKIAQSRGRRFRYFVRCATLAFFRGSKMKTFGPRKVRVCRIPQGVCFRTHKFNNAPKLNATCLEFPKRLRACEIVY